MNTTYRATSANEPATCDYCIESSEGPPARAIYDWDNADNVRLNAHTSLKLARDYRARRLGSTMLEWQRQTAILANAETARRAYRHLRHLGAS